MPGASAVARGEGLEEGTPGETRTPEDIEFEELKNSLFEEVKFVHTEM